MQLKFNQKFNQKANEKFERYHFLNPQIYNAFRYFTLKAIEKGYKRLSAEFIINIIRWETKISATDDDYKINNNYKAFYVRKFISDFPKYKNLFELRTSKADA